MTEESTTGAWIVPETTWAYLAGLIDGEGYLGVAHKTSIALEIAMTDREVIDWLKDTFGGCVYTPTVPRPNAKQYWKWTVTVGILEQILPRIQPYMIVKKQHVELMIEFCGIRQVRSGPRRPDQNERVLEICQNLKALTRRGVTPKQNVNGAL